MLRRVGHRLLQSEKFHLVETNVRRNIGAHYYISDPGFKLFENLEQFPATNILNIEIVSVVRLTYYIL